MARGTRSGVILVWLFVALGGCGGSGAGDAGKVKASFAAWVHDLQHHDAAAACNDMTPAFWSAFAGEVNGGLAASGRSASVSDSTSNCQVGLRSLFGLAGGGAIVRSGVHATDVVVHGKTATAQEVGASSHSTPVRFVQEGDQWRLNCCVGRQLEQQAQTTYRIPSGSMLPTLRVGQVVVSDNAALRAHPPALGAIVVFHPPAGADSPDPQCGLGHEGAGSPRPCGMPTAGESSDVFIKRVVGLPGDRIALVHGTVIRNGRPEPRNYKVEPCGSDAVCHFPQAITIPADEYFVLGDNLPASDDSRFWGPVKRSWLIGVVNVGG